MNILKGLFSLILIFIFTNAIGKSSIITGKIAHPERPYVDVIYKTPFLGIMKIESVEMVNDSFSFAVDVLETTLLSLGFSANAGVLLLAVPGENIHFSMDINRPENSLMVTAKNSVDINFINRYTYAQMSLDRSDEQQFASIQETIAFQQKQRHQLADSLQQDGKVSKAALSAVHLQQQQSDYERLAGIYRGKAIASSSSLQSTSTIEEGEIEALLSRVKIEDEAQLVQSDYWDFVYEYQLSKYGEYLSAHYTPSERRAMDESYCDTMFNYAKQVFKNDNIRYAAQARLLASNARGWEPEVVKRLSKQLAAEFPNGRFIEEVIALQEDKRLVVSGTTAAAFSLKDTAGNIVSLASLKGKVVLLDFWASWCLPCIGENKALQAIKAHFAGKDIVFVHLSRDADEAMWKDAIVKQKIDGLHLITGLGSVFRDYQVDGVPHFMIIDRAGIIKQHNAARPSQQEKLIAQIEEALAN